MISNTLLAVGFYETNEPIQNPTVIYTDNAFECPVWLIKGEEGGYTAIVPTLPGAISEGETVDEAISNITEALQGALGRYLEAGSIPWRDEPQKADEEIAFKKRIVVNV